ncbi:hypothetical protein [Glycomyces sp. NPDC048151]|uniref:COG4315 family predicted lipoprotein n=1 Tax=Glycomyces sp. NPDC048151 TaxID=3364002 RepID=UPI00371958FE
MTRWIRHQRACAAAAAAFALLGAAACGDSDGGSDGGPYGADPTSASESPSESPTAAADASLGTATDDDHGEFLVDSDGFALYLFTTDTPNTPTCYDSCATAWPPMIAGGDVGANGAVDAALIGTVERTDGTMQVTYNGWPLYYYAQDDEPGETEGQGVQNVWYLVGPNGDANTTDT